MSIEFKECATCAAKPGCPALCASCVWNRGVIDRLQEGLAAFRKAAKILDGIEERLETELEKRRVR